VIRHKCRYSTRAVLLDGDQVSRGPVLDDCLIQTELPRRGPKGVVGVPADGNLVSVTRTAGGVVVEELVRPRSDGLVFNAVIEDPSGRARDHVLSLEPAAATLVARLANQHDDLDPERQQRVQKLVFDRARTTGDLSLLEGVHAFPRTAGGPLDLDAVRRAADRGTLFAVGADEPSGSHLSEGLTVLRLEARARQFLTSVAGIPLPAPPRRADDAALRVTLGARAGLALERIRRAFLPGPGPAIPDERLDPKERAFVEAARAAIDRPVAMTESDRRPSFRPRGAEGVAKIGRRHPLVRRMIAAFADDPAYLAPAVAVLTEGERRVK
jgi:hypothetical protein